MPGPEIPARTPSDQAEIDLRFREAARRIARACEILARRYDLPLEAVALGAMTRAIVADPAEIEYSIARFMERLVERTESER